MHFRCMKLTVDNTTIFLNSSVVSDMKDMLVHIVENLPQQDRLVIALYYYEELTFKEIASVLRLSESRVFQKHAAILERLREQVDELA